MARHPAAVEHGYTDSIGQFVARGLTWVSRLVPFSLAELATGVLLVWALVLAGRAAVQVAGRRRHLLNAAAGGMLWLASLTGILLISGYVAWGFNFARPDLVTRQQWSGFSTAAAPDSAAQELSLYCTRLVELANREFETSFGTRDPGQPSAPRSGAAPADAAIEDAYARVAEKLKLPPYFAAKRGRAKPVLASFTMSAVLVAGFYSPWTGEANYNRELPPYSIPHTIAHEKAHQRCITSEDEANFFGFLACIYSRDPYVRYSGYMFAQEQLLSELRRVAPRKAAGLVARRDPGVQRDVDSYREFVRRHEGFISDLDSAAIDTYLKANRAPGGIQSYNLSSRLIIIYARAVDSSFSSI